MAAGRKRYRPQSIRRREIGRVGAGKTSTGGFFNNIPAIIAAFPVEVGNIVIETTEEEFVPRAQAKAPRGETGRLRVEVNTRFRNAKGGVMARVDFDAGEDEGHEYPFYVEVGTVDTPAQPFVVPSIEETRPVFHQKLRGLEGRLPGWLGPTLPGGRR